MSTKNDEANQPAWIGVITAIGILIVFIFAAIRTYDRWAHQKELKAESAAISDDWLKAQMVKSTTTNK